MTWDTVNNYIISGLILLVLVCWGTYEHNRFLTVKTEFTEFRETSIAQALKQEKEHALQVNNALSQRDVALNRLRDSEARSRSSFIPKTAGSPETACYNRARLDAALSKFEEGIRGLLSEGDEAIINDRTWLASWPR